MIKRTLIITILLIVQSCVHREKETYPELHEDVFLEMVNCFNITGEFFSIWRENGGKVESSILKMRDHIKKDNKSDFALLIKDSWRKQEDMGFSEKIKDIGKWRSTQGRRFALVSDSFYFSDKNNLGECKSLGAWNETMYEEFTRDDNRRMQPRLMEFPKDRQWKYPDNMLWLKYWLFVNIKTKGGR